ncbi:MAG: HAD family hydrolase [Hyphomicrobiales bacterium]|nr:MAG: HAD family hydrolase [Hyphomicrobiales bacterium]
MKLVLFDCDGTLADSFGLICEAMRLTFLEHGLAAPEDAATRAIIGLSLHTAIQDLAPTAPPALIEAMVASYRTNFRATREDPAFREALFAGIKPMLDDLVRRKDVRLGLVTGKTRRGVDAVVSAHALEGMFQAIRTADDCPSKPHPAMVLECCAELGIDPAATIVVGDAIHDIGMALAAGAEAIGVPWGAASPEMLLDAGAARIAADVPDLAALLDAWIAGRWSPDQAAYA